MPDTITIDCSITPRERNGLTPHLHQKAGVLSFTVEQVTTYFSSLNTLNTKSGYSVMLGFLGMPVFNACALDFFEENNLFKLLPSCKEHSYCFPNTIYINKEKNSIYVATISWGVGICFQEIGPSTWYGGLKGLGLK